jgi:hypothetical protein
LIGLLYGNWGADSLKSTLIDPNHNICVIWALFKTKNDAFLLFCKQITVILDYLLFMVLIGLLYVNWGVEPKKCSN